METERVSELLQRYGVNYMQGYHFGPPSANTPWNPRVPRLQVVRKNATAEQFGGGERQQPKLPAGGKVNSLVTRH